MQLTTTHKLDAASSAVHAVTIFQSDCAEVVRKFAINLKTGDNVVEISHLPHTMVTESLRVAGMGQAMLSDVVAITPKNRSFKHGQSDKSEITIALEEEKELILSQRRVVDHQASILVNYSKSITGEHVAPEDMLAFLSSFVTLGDENAKAIQELNQRQRSVEKKIAKELDDPAEEHDSSHLRNIKVKLVINADEDHVAEITLTYLVKKASWTPVFDLRAVTGPDGKPTTKVALHYRATVNQSTGEDWMDSTLNLSTASPDTRGTKLPTLSTIKITPKKLFSGGNKGGGLFGQQQNTNANPFGQQAAGTFSQSRTVGGFGAFGQASGNSLAPPPSLFGTAAPAAPRGGLFGGGGATAAPSFGALSAIGAASNADTATSLAAPAYVGDNPVEAWEITPLPEMEIPSAVAKENSLATNFQVKGVANIKSDGSSHRVAISIMNLTAKMHSVVVPRSLGGAYIHCTIHNSSTDTHLLPGNMGIYLDEGYITNTTVPHVAPGETFKCSLGRDYSVGVTFDQKVKRIETPSTIFGANRDRVLFTVTLTLNNKRDSPLKGLVVRDVIPVSEISQVKVLLLKPEGLAEAQEGNDVTVEDGVKVRWFEPIGDRGGMKEGRHQWLVDLEGRETKVLVTEWEVSTTPGYHWAYTTQASDL